MSKKTWYIRIRADTEKEALEMFSPLISVFKIAAKVGLPMEHFSLEHGRNKLSCSLKKRFTDRQLDKMEKDE